MHNTTGDVLAMADALATAVASGYMAREFAKNVWMNYLEKCGLLPVQKVFKPIVVPPIENKVEEKK